CARVGHAGVKGRGDPVDFSLCARDFPAQAHVQRETFGYLPVVAHVERRVPGLRVGVLNVLLGQTGTVHIAQQETGIGVAGRACVNTVGCGLVVELEGARSAPVPGLDVVILPDFNAKPEVVLAVDPGGVVGEDVTAVRRVAGRVVPDLGHGTPSGGCACKSSHR